MQFKLFFMPKQHEVDRRGHVKLLSRQTIYPILLLAGVVVPAAWMFAVCHSAREIHYLPEEKPGEWIIHPISLDLGGHPTIEEKAVFRRSFSLPGLPAAAPLRISACEHFSAADQRQRH